MHKLIQGIAASGGIAFGKAYVIKEQPITFDTYSKKNPSEELAQLERALAKAEDELQHIRHTVGEEQGVENAAIFDAQLLVLDDPELLQSIEDKVTNEQRTVESALDESANYYITLFEQMDDAYMQERAADIKDITRRILLHLLGIKMPKIRDITEDTIIISEDITPSQTAQMDLNVIKGFVTNLGGETSHTAIMARTLEVPAIVGTQNATEQIQQGDIIIVDGDSGDIHLNPSTKLKEKMIQKRDAYEAEKATWLLLKNKPTLTHDMHQIELAANIGSPQDVHQVLRHGAEGIGLYRTEFLYMESAKLPTEEEQFEAYRYVLERMGDKPVVVRTIDIGGDKKLPYLPLPDETNPFLGLRAVRFSLQETDMFRTQIRALLRSSNYGNLKIMFPMIATLEEFHQAKALVETEKARLQKEEFITLGPIELGMMVEIPSAAILAHQFAKEVDFFSIGTNDLIQYTLAADRMNENVAYLYQPYHPAILQLIKLVIDAAHQEGKWVGMCGEMASDLTAIPILLGLGLDEFSMSAPSILQARNLVRKLTQTEMKKLAERALTCKTADEVEKFISTELAWLKDR